MPRALAIDCGMIAGKKNDIAARVSIVDEDGEIVLDKYIKQSKKISDFRSFVSGVTKEKLESATEGLEEIRKQVAKLIHGNILVGHTLKKDLTVLGLCHPEERSRDLALYPPFKAMNGGQPTSLKTLAMTILGRSIQNGPHCSIEDTKASIDIYKKYSSEWDKWV